MCVNKTHYRPATLDKPHNKTKVSMPKKIKYLIITFNHLVELNTYILYQFLDVTIKNSISF